MKLREFLEDFLDFNEREESRRDEMRPKGTRKTYRRNYAHRSEMIERILEHNCDFLATYNDMTGWDKMKLMGFVRMLWNNRDKLELTHEEENNIQQLLDIDKQYETENSEWRIKDANRRIQEDDRPFTLIRYPNNTYHFKKESHSFYINKIPLTIVDKWVESLKRDYPDRCVIEER